MLLIPSLKYARVPLSVYQLTEEDDSFLLKSQLCCFCGAGSGQAFREIKEGKKLHAWAAHHKKPLCKLKAMHLLSTLVGRF